MRIKEENIFLKNMLYEYCHPSTALWRSIELKIIYEYVTKYGIQGPILDLGCGDGKVAKYIFKDKNIDVGLEIDQEVIFAVKKSNAYKHLTIADACALPFKMSSYQVIFSNCVIEHISDNEEILRNVSYCLKNGGLFIFTVPSNKFGEYLFFSSLLKKIGLKKIAKIYAKIRNKLLNHYHCYNIEEWKNKLKKYNLNYTNHTYYLSKRGIQLWDFMAVIIYMLNRLRIWYFLEKVFKSSPLLNKIRIWICIFLFSPFYNDRIESDGGGLFIVARKD